MKTKWQEIIPFKGRHHSGSSRLNFLLKSENIYVMDNHLAALWCWADSMDLNEPHSLLHIDRHYDALECNLSEIIKHVPGLTEPIENYLQATYPIGSDHYKVFRWDNYLSIYLNKYSKQCEILRLATHDEGDRPQHNNILKSEIWDLPENISYWLEERSFNWIVNIDLDYFYCNSPDDKLLLWATDAYLNSVFSQLKYCLDQKHIKALTLCLTPNGYTPGWTEAEALASKILKILGKDFNLK